MRGLGNTIPAYQVQTLVVAALGNHTRAIEAARFMENRGTSHRGKVLGGDNVVRANQSG